GLLPHLTRPASPGGSPVKPSFVEPLQTAPQLMLGDRSVAGVRGDSNGRFWQFDVAGLAPATAYTLQIVDAAGRALCDPWPLRTFPAPDAPAAGLRILAYTCGGGYNGIKLGNMTLFLEMAEGRRLLAKALSHRPDVVISNGDMIYWDMATALNKGEALAKVAHAAWAKFGMLDLTQPIYGT